MKARPEILVGSRNAGKVREIQALLEGIPVVWRGLAEFRGAPEVEESGATFEENAGEKALILAAHLGLWVLADDSGLEVDALGGAPGVRSARYAGQHGDDASNIAKLLHALENVPDDARTARFRCAVALAAPGRMLLTASGVCEGRIVRTPRGDRGFGYDPVFLYPPAGKTFGELEEEYKNRVSHRAAALRRIGEALIPFLQSTEAPVQETPAG
ncbi:MAG: XTP/dITP diphosphatase [Planctomycetes bacterium]|nr:XTP/dITP diphosphatase [Planctomycetota bacterium]